MRHTKFMMEMNNPSDTKTKLSKCTRELSDQLSNRYKIIHMAEDMGVNTATLYRFMKGKDVKGELYDKAFKYLIKK